MSHVVNHSTFKCPMAWEVGSPQYRSTDDSEEDGLACNANSLTNFNKTSTGNLETVDKNINLGNIVGVPPPPVSDDEQHFSGSRQHSGNQGNANKNMTSSHSESLETEGREDTLQANGHNQESNVFDEDPSDKESDDKGILPPPVSANCVYEGSVSSSGSSRSKYEKGEITFIDSMANCSSTLLWNGMAAYSNLSSGKSSGCSSFERKPSNAMEHFHSVQDWVASESGLVFEGSPTESGIQETDRIRILRQIDELKDQIIRSCVAHGRVITDEHHDEIGDEAHYHPQSDSFRSSHDGCRRLPSFLQKPPLSMVGSRNRMGHNYQISQRPSTLSNHTQHQLHSLSHDHYRASERVKFEQYFNNATHENRHHVCSHHPNSNVLKYNAYTKTACSHHDTRGHSLEVQNKNRKAEDHIVKFHCRPVFGGSRFISCYKCLQVLEAPEDFLFLSIHGKLRCGFCLRVLKFSIYEKTRIVPYCLAVKQLPLNEAGDDSDADAVIQGTSSPNDRGSQGRHVSN